jgi:iron only hydrogenase large subunit-like protein
MKKTETLNLKCILSNDEMLEISKEMSEHLNKKKQAEDNLASFSAQLKAEIKGHDATINKSATLINSGFEYRNIKCEVIIDEKKNAVNWIREDTGKICQTENPIPTRYLQKEIDL